LHSETSPIIFEGTAKNSCGKVNYMGDVQEPEKVKNTCVKTMHVGTMDRGFNVFMSVLVTVIVNTKKTGLQCTQFYFCEDINNFMKLIQNS
jgi:hypothetical protein